MSLLFESIRIEGGTFRRLDLHQQRLNRSRAALFGPVPPIDLSRELSVPAGLSPGPVKCRVICGTEIERVEFVTYVPKAVRTLRIIEDNTIDYAHKYDDRSCFERHLSQAQADDILIMKDGLISDTSYSNIVFFDGREWWTPERPLLCGTRRKDLLERNIIRTAKVAPADLPRFEFAVMINAMLGLNEGPRIPVENILT